MTDVLVETGQTWRSLRPSEQGHTVSVLGLSTASGGVVRWRVQSSTSGRCYTMRESTLLERFERVDPLNFVESAIGAPGL